MSARDKIIETTCELLELQGYHATGLNEIIKESGSPKGSLYYYFPGGKEELTAEAINRVGQIIIQRIKTNLEAVEDPAEAVRQFILNVAYNVQASGFRTGGPITTVALETAATSERLNQVCSAIYKAWEGAFYEKLVKHGISPERAERLSSVIISSLEGGIILSRTYKNVKALVNIAEEMGLLVNSAR